MLRDKLNLALIAGIVIAVCGILIYSPAPAVKAAEPSLAIHIVDKVGEVAVTTITFPTGDTGATVSAPYNNVNGVDDPQIVAGAGSEPVVRLHNTSGGPLLVTLAITVWTEGVVASEDYELVDEAPTDVSVVDDVLSDDGGAASVDTGVSIPADGKKALYLEVTLSAGYGKSGTSTITILGEQ